MSAASKASILARAIRAHALRMTHKANASHIGTSLSIADILAVLYGGVLRVNPARPDWPDRDRFILSKGHGCAALYAVLAEQGFFAKEWLETYCQDGCHLAGHITSHGVPAEPEALRGVWHWFHLASAIFILWSNRHPAVDDSLYYPGASKETEASPHTR